MPRPTLESGTAAPVTAGAKATVSLLLPKGLTISKSSTVGRGPRRLRGLHLAHARHRARGSDGAPWWLADGGVAAPPRAPGPIRSTVTSQFQGRARRTLPTGHTCAGQTWLPNAFVKRLWRVGVRRASMACMTSMRRRASARTAWWWSFARCGCGGRRPCCRDGSASRRPITRRRARASCCPRRRV